MGKFDATQGNIVVDANFDANYVDPGGIIVLLEFLYIFHNFVGSHFPWQFTPPPHPLVKSLTVAICVSTKPSLVEIKVLASWSALEGLFVRKSRPVLNEKGKYRSSELRIRF